jgi:sigma-B regulation protein RsbU (phosphoserine phosphatase)
MDTLYILNGPNIGESFELNDGYTYIGRSAKNDIRIEDKTVSRRHLRIADYGGKYLLTDLKSRNGTFCNGKYIGHPFQFEVKEGEPIAIGMTLICIGEACVEQMMPFLDSVELTKNTGEQSGIFKVHKHRTNIKKLELLYSVTDTLSEDLPLNKALTRILGHMLHLLGRIDTGSFILLDPETGSFGDVISVSPKPLDESPISYCSDLVRRVIHGRKPVAISNVQAEESEFIDTLKIQRIVSVMCIPLLSDSQVLGAMYFDSLGRRYEFSGEDISFFAGLSHRIAVAIEGSRFESDIKTVADKLSSDS